MLRIEVLSFMIVINSCFTVITDYYRNVLEYILVIHVGDGVGVTDTCSIHSAFRRVHSSR